MWTKTQFQEVYRAWKEMQDTYDRRKRELTAAEENFERVAGTVRSLRAQLDDMLATGVDL